MGATEIYQPTFSKVLAYAVWVVLILIAISGFISKPFITSAQILLGCVCAAAFVWLFYFRPKVEVADGGVTVTNPFQTVHVPWPAVTDLRVRGTFEIETANSGRVSAYAASIANKRTDSGLAGIVLERSQNRLSALRDAGFLDEVRIEGAPVTRTTFTAGIIALAMPAVLLVVLILI